YARAGAVGRAQVEDACWGVDGDGAPNAFEYWAHAACVVPVALWPWFAFRRRRYRQTRRWNMEAPPEILDGVRRRLAAEGPLTAAELGGAKRGGPWWDWSPVKVAVELLLDWGEVACVRRAGWRRVYDLSERAIPAHLIDHQPLDDRACVTHLVRTAGTCLGAATEADLAEYFRLRRDDVRAAVPDSGLVPVTVEGWPQPGWADPVALEQVDGRGRHRTTLLSPFDSLIWDRPRTARLFGFTHRIEAYTPAPKRQYGYYAMPVLAGGRLIGRVYPGRAGRTLVAKQVSLDRATEIAAVGTALVEAASWVGADSVAIGAVDPPALTAALRSAVSA
ncbi:MAG: winged helix-turn-helix domain-containing protein, partial [Acidimicrobiales bacterium]